MRNTPDNPSLVYIFPEPCLAGDVFLSLFAGSVRPFTWGIVYIYIYIYVCSYDYG